MPEKEIFLNNKNKRLAIPDCILSKVDYFDLRKSIEMRVISKNFLGSGPPVSGYRMSGLAG
jgi:hypothetical protein